MTADTDNATTTTTTASAGIGTTATTATTEATGEIMLGFAEPFDTDATRDATLSKIGGRPMWLHPDQPLPADKALCGVCGKPMLLFVQLYAPEDEVTHAFHRVIYVFLCKSGACHKSSRTKCIKAFRCQLEDMPDDITATTTATCVLCGLGGTKSCGKCHQADYCSRDHQILHWNIGYHKAACGKDPSARAAYDKLDNAKFEKFLFPEYEIVSEADDYIDRERQQLGDTMQALTLADDRIHRGTATGWTEEDFEQAQIGVDKTFLKFQKRIRHNPDQIIRYTRTEYHRLTSGSHAHAQPLWVNADGQLDERDVPTCACGKPRTFEFQIMPQVLSYLELDETDPSALDFGTLVVYTCSESCDYRNRILDADDQRKAHRNQDCFHEEFVWRQDFAADSAGSDEWRRGRFGTK